MSPVGMASRADWVLRVVVVSAIGLLTAAIVIESCRGRVRVPVERVPMSTTAAATTTPDSLTQHPVAESVSRDSGNPAGK